VRARRETELLEEVAMREAMRLTGKSRRWFYDREKDGTFEVFRHSSRDVTLSRRSLVAWQQAGRVARPALEVVAGG